MSLSETPFSAVAPPPPSPDEAALSAALAGVSSAFASLGRVFFCVDASFHVLHASSHLDHLLGRGAARRAEGRPLADLLGSDLFGPAGTLRQLLLAGERREGWRSSLAVPGSAPRAVSVTAAPFCAEPGAVCDPRVAYVVVLRPAEEEQIQAGSLFPGLIGRSPGLERIFRLIENLEHSEATVLLTGESGTGKEVVARAVHARSPRRGGPFVALNCGALPGEVENVPETADSERVMESMIKQGAKLIVAASFGYLDPALRVAKKYPEVKFVHPAGFKRAPNLTTYWASTPEAFYLMGIAAGKTTKTSKVGFVCALPVSFFLGNVNALHLGARSVNPKVETRIVFTGTFLDPGKEATATNALLEQGSDVMGMIVDSPITVFQTAEKRGAYSVGYHYLGVQKFAPKGWIGGVAFTWGGLYTRFAKEVMDGTWKSENILGNLASDMITLTPFGAAVPPDAIKIGG